MSTEKTLLKARALAKRGSVIQARALYMSVLDRFPTNKRALDGLKALSELGPPPDPTQLIRALFEQYTSGRMQELVLATDAAIKTYPENAQLLRLRAAGQVAIGQAVNAIATYDALIALDPADADAYGNRGNAQRAAGQDEAARQSFHKVLELRPRDATALNNIGNIHIDRGALDEAQQVFEAALDASPHYGPALNNLGNVLKIRGDTARAAEILSQAIRTGQATAEAFWNLASVKTFEKDAPEIARMEQALGQSQLPDREKMLIGFALGKAYDDTGDVARAFHHLVAANHIQKSLLAYDLDKDISGLHAQMAVFSESAADFACSTSRTQGDAPIPVFIVGMPRSGTSLVEQMLSAHSEIHGAGELPFLDNTLLGLDWNNIDAFSSVHLRLRQEYLAHLDAISGGAAYVTDKLPLNFQWVGAIFSMFPNARIVHVERDARATCWSNFKHYFSSKGNGYAYNLDDVVAYYLAYSDLMQHWHTLFGNRIFRLDYDHMTADPEPCLRDLIRYLGLEWQDACLAPEQNRRAVYTSSATQVRRRVYQNSSRDWKRFAGLIGPAFDALP